MDRQGQYSRQNSPDCRQGLEGTSADHSRAGRNKCSASYFCYRTEIATMTDRHGDEKGIALILVIWILVILMVIVLSFAYMTKVESGSTTSFKEGVEEKFIAEAGIERAAEELMYRKINLGVPIEEGKEGIWRTDGTSNTFTVGDGTC